MLVLFRQARPVRLHRSPQLQGLRDHRRDHAVEFDRPLVVAVRLEGEHDLQRSAGPAPDGNRDGDVRELPRAPRPLTSLRSQRRLLAHAGHHHRLAGVDDPVGDALPGALPAPLGGQAYAHGGFGVHLAVLGVLEVDGSADHLVAALEDVEH